MAKPCVYRVHSGEDPSSAELEDMVSEVDRDGDGKIDLLEFCRTMTTKLRPAADTTPRDPATSQIRQPTGGSERAKGASNADRKHVPAVAPFGEQMHTSRPRDSSKPRIRQPTGGGRRVTGGSAADAHSVPVTEPVDSQGNRIHIKQPTTKRGGAKPRNSERAQANGK